MTKRLDIILFGATGFTGKYGIVTLHQLIKVSGSETLLTWGIAGRSETKLKEALAQCQKKLGDCTALENIPFIVADVKDYDSLIKMTRSARIIINYCGPYRLYGEPVIKACIETGTHYVDVCGEVEFMEGMQLKYHELAREKGVYIVNTCGIDSIAADLGVIFLENHFEGVLNSVETFMELDTNSLAPTKGLLNIGTWESLILSFTNVNELKKIRSQLFKKPLPKLLPKLKSRSTHEKIDFIDSNYIVPFLGSDRSVVLRTQQYLFEHKNKRPLQIQTYQVVKSKSGLFLLAIYGMLFKFLVQREFGRKLLLKFPEFFSNGYFTRAENLPEEKLSKVKVTLKLLGKGWDPDSPKMDDGYNFKEPPNKTIAGFVEGYNPGYYVAAGASILSAFVVLLETDKLPPGGGVYTPGAAFIDTSLIKRLHENNVLSFKLKSKL